MVLNILRGIFVLLMAAVGYSLVTADPENLGDLEGVHWLALAMCVSLSLLVIAIDILGGRRKLAIFSGVAFGVLAGLAVSYALSFAVVLVVDNVFLPTTVGSEINATVTGFLNLLIGTIVCYFSVAFVLQTKDDFRFIIPYIEFRRDARGTKPVLVDTSALVDGRLEEVATAGFLDTRLVVPHFVVNELQTLADQADRHKGQRGRRGLDVLARLQRAAGLDVRIYDSHGHEPKDADDLPVDRRLVDLARTLEAKLLTVDFNLAKVAQLAGVNTLNINQLARALQSEVVPGDALEVLLAREGTGDDQGVGHLDDGTMIVVENAAASVGKRVSVTVTNLTQTNAGRMIFAKLRNNPPVPHRKHKSTFELERPLAG
jgi:uncharacterized protein YacL